MITMTDINTIKNLRNAHGKSIREISRILGVDWRTAKKYADEDINPVPEVKVKKGMMYTEKCRKTDNFKPPISYILQPPFTAFTVLLAFIVCLVGGLLFMFVG